METLTVNTAELIDQIAAQDEKITKSQAKALIEGFLNAIRDSAARGEETSLPGFGKFKVQSKPARTGRNPSTGAAIEIAASRKIVFQPAKVLKDAVNQ
jgi:DNA-binding protein HU-beta